MVRYSSTRLICVSLFSRIVLRNWQQGKTSHLEWKRQIQRLKVDKRRFVFSSQHYYMKLSADWSIGRESGRPALLYQAEISHRLDTWNSWGWLVVFYTSPNRQLGIFYDPTWQFRCELVQRELMEFFNVRTTTMVAIFFISLYLPHEWIYQCCCWMCPF